MRKQVKSRKLTTAQIARILTVQGQVNAIKNALAAEAASWPEGTWSSDQETRLDEKLRAQSELRGDHSRAADDMYHRLRVERRLLDQLGFAEALLARLVK